MTDEGELSDAGTVAKSATVQCEGRREVVSGAILNARQLLQNLQQLPSME